MNYAFFCRPSFGSVGSVNSRRSSAAGSSIKPSGNTWKERKAQITNAAYKAENLRIVVEFLQKYGRDDYDFSSKRLKSPQMRDFAAAFQVHENNSVL